MTPQERNVMEQARRAINNLISSSHLKDPQPWRDARQDSVDALTAIEEALAQPEQEPVAWMYVNQDGECEDIGYGNTYLAGHEGCTPLYTTPPQRKPMTDEQIAAIGKELGLKCRLGGNPNIDFDYARAIEAAHGITEE